MSTSSTNIRGFRNPLSGFRTVLIPDSFLFYGDDGDLPAVLAVVFEADLAVDLREQGVILAQPDVEPGLEAASLLPHENRAARHEVAVVTLDAETLRIAVSTVA